MFRKKRNIGDYERAGMVSAQEAHEMADLAKRIRREVAQWLIDGHPELMEK
ncbi:MAG: hypothetical protein JW832_10785 [Deltaproteobacteria bacterium]|nr:hypothetical protein [Deltaproteobacteria bacterium]